MTTTFDVDRDGLINDTLRLMGVLSDGEAAGATDLTNCSRTLNLLLKEWAENGKKPWAIRTVTTPFVASKVSWTIGPTGDITPDRPQTVLSSWWENAQGQRFPMFPVDRDRYQRLSPKNQTSSSPTNWYYDAQLTNGVWAPWPLCAGTNGTFYIDAQFALEDVLLGTDKIKVAPSTFNAVKWGLANELLTEYGVHPDIAKIIAIRAPLKVAAAADLEEEQGSVRFQPRAMPGHH